MTFSIFFSTINFSYQYLPEAKVYLEPSRTFYNEALLRNIYLFLCKIHKKTPVLESHFNKVTGLYPATSLKERTPTQVFSDEFCEILKTLFLQNTSRRLVLFYGEKNFIKKIVKNPLRKGKKMETAFKKNNHTGKAKT